MVFINVFVFFKYLPRRLENAWWYFRGLVWDKHNVIKVKTLPPTWVDADFKILHVCFKIFCDVIEKEKLLETHSFDYTEEIEKAKKEDWDYERRQEYIRSLETEEPVGSFYPWRGNSLTHQT